jgi:cell wall-associated NlpC family hydrolase
MKLFDTPENFERLERAADRWVYTPFFKGSRAPGRDGGVDCVNLVCALLGECGLRLPPLPQDYPLDFSSHQTDSLIERFIRENDLEKHFEVVEQPDEQQLQPGDILHFNIEGGINHLGTMLGNGMFIHCLQPWGVRRTSLKAGLRYGKLVKIRIPIKTL